MSIGMPTFKALYGYNALTFVEMIFGDSRAPKTKYWVEESQVILNILKDNLQVAQNQQNNMQIDIEKKRNFRLMIYYI